MAEHSSGLEPLIEHFEDKLKQMRAVHDERIADAVAAEEPAAVEPLAEENDGQTEV